MLHKIQLICTLIFALCVLKICQLQGEKTLAPLKRHCPWTPLGAAEGPQTPAFQD